MSEDGRDAFFILVLPFIVVIVVLALIEVFAK